MGDVALSAKLGVSDSPKLCQDTEYQHNLTEVGKSSVLFGGISSLEFNTNVSNPIMAGTRACTVAPR